MVLGFLGLTAAPSGQAASRPVASKQGARWMRSIVTVEVARKQFDFWQPWNTRTRSALKTGLVIGKHQVLTTAQHMYDRTLVRLQKDGSGEWWLGEVQWIDYHANLALVSAKDQSFWEGLRPAALRGASPEDPLQIARWGQGNLELRRAEFTRYEIGEGELSGVNQVTMMCDSDISGLDGGEPLIANSHCAGIVTAQSGRRCTIMPAALIRAILDGRANGTYHGLGYFHWYWQPAMNLDSLARLKLHGKPRGVIVCDVPERPDGLPSVMKVGDVILQIDGFDADTMGNYQDPDFGRILLENLASRGKWAGDEVRLKVWRDGEEISLSYRLPRYEYTNSLVPAARYDTPPEYLIVGGLVFQPLTDEFLQSWGAEWKRKGPFRLSFYRNQPRTEERKSLVLLSQVLPDDYNIGYQEQRLLVVNKVNGRRVNTISDLHEAVQHAEDGFHRLEFMPGDTLKRMVVRAGEAEKEATARVLKRYGIRQAQQLNGKNPTPPAS